MKDPIVIDPPNFDQKAAWNECREYVDKCGGLTDDDGEPNWRAAFGADPGCCSCPVCHEYYWQWGRVQKCVDCGFEYPVDWWPSYSEGVTAASWINGEIEINSDGRKRVLAGKIERHTQRMHNPYYRHGFENKPPAEACGIKLMDYAQSIPWREIVRSTPADAGTEGK